MKPRVAVFSFTCCEGCSLAILECENQLLDLLEIIDLVEWREAMSEKTDEPIDIALVDGSISSQHGVDKIKKVRKRAETVVAIGACAHTAGLNALKNRYTMTEAKDIVYGDAGQDKDTIPARPVSAVVDVDFELPGCPIDRGEFVRTVRDVALGKTPRIPDYPVCVECKRQGNTCVFFQGKFCMGPVIRAGCGAICPTYGDGCEGCRGFIDDPNEDAHEETLAEHGLTAEEIMQHFDMFNAYRQHEQAEA